MPSPRYTLYPPLLFPLIAFYNLSGGDGVREVFVGTTLSLIEVRARNANTGDMYWEHVRLEYHNSEAMMALNETPKCLLILDRYIAPSGRVLHTQRFGL